jgi:hypothetical protein
MKKINYIVVLRLSLDSVKDIPIPDSPETWPWAELIGERVKLLACQKERKNVRK